MWADIVRVGGSELLDRCPDLYRPDRGFAEGRHLLNAVVEKTPKGEVMRGFVGEAPDLESLIGPAVNAALSRVNGPDSDGDRDRGAGSLLDRVTVKEPFSGSEKEGAAHTL